MDVTPSPSTAVDVEEEHVYSQAEWIPPQLPKGWITFQASVTKLVWGDRQQSHLALIVMRSDTSEIQASP